MYKNGQVELTSKPSAKTTPRVATDFKLFVPDPIWKKIHYWIHKSDHEVSGFGSLDWDEDTNVFTVRDVILLQQKVGPTSAEIDPLALNKAMYEQRDEPNGLKWHWHSHVDMPVFWSGDDMEIIRSLGQQDWILASVFNKRNESRTAFLTQVQIFERPHDVFVDEIPTKIVDSISPELAAQLDREYTEKVSPENAWSYPKNAPAEAYAPAWVYEEQSENAETLPVGRASKEDLQGFDEHGYAKFGNDWIYNPIFDQTLTTVEERYRAIDEMDWREITYLREQHAGFNRLLTGYFEWMANAKDGPGLLDLSGKTVEDLEYQNLIQGVEA